MFACCERPNIIKNKEVTFKVAEQDIKANKNEPKERDTLKQANACKLSKIQTIKSTNTYNLELAAKSKDYSDEGNKTKESTNTNTLEISNQQEIKNNSNCLNSEKQSKSSKNNNEKEKEKDEKGTVISFSNLNLYQNNNEEVEKQGSKLLLTGELFFNKEIIITMHGMKNGLRKKCDDLSFFGLKNSKDYKGTFYNDFVINFPQNLKEDENYANIETTTGRIFEICYQKRANAYALHFIHNTLILYYKVNNYVYFQPDKDYFFILGNVFLTINVRKLSPCEKGINLQVEIENENSKKYSFKQSQCPIKIGRVNSDITIQKQCISKSHSIIEFSQNNQMFYYKDLGSTNGSTLLIREDDSLQIKGAMHFKLEDIPFKIQELP